MFARLRSSPSGPVIRLLAIILVAINLSNGQQENTYLNYNEVNQCGAALHKPRPKSAYMTGGDDVLPGEFPSAVLVDVNGGICSGVIYRKDVVLTAAHCFLPETRREFATDRNMVVTVYVGLEDTRFKGSARKHEVGYVIRGNIVDNENRLLPQEPDIAQLILRTQIEYADMAQPACVLRDSTHYEALMKSGRCYIVGYGLKQFRFRPDGSVDPAVPVIFQDKLQKVRVEPTSCYPRAVPHEVCSWAANRDGVDRGPCAGDSGAPWLCLDWNSRWVTVAIYKSSFNVYVPGVGDIDRGCVLGQSSRYQANAPDISFALTSMSSVLDQSRLDEIRKFLQEHPPNRRPKWHRRPRGRVLFDFQHDYRHKKTVAMDRRNFSAAGVRTT